MSKTGYITARIEPHLKAEAEAILHQLGLNTTDAINLLYRQVVLNNGLPFAIKIPNNETLEAMEEASSKSKTLTRYDTVNSMMNDLWK